MLGLTWKIGIRSNRIEWEPSEEDLAEVERIKQLPEDDPDYDPDPDIPGPPLPRFYATWVLAERLTSSDVFKLSGLPYEEPYLGWWTYWGGVCREARIKADELHDAYYLDKARQAQK